MTGLPFVSRKPLLLDLFCGAGGAAVGYHRAGFDVIGVDKEPQPNYPFHFIRTDALEFLAMPFVGRGFDVIHASPPCQAHSDLQKQNKREYPELIAPTRLLLDHTGLPYVIENVEGAPLVNPVVLCGTTFSGLRVIRHRLFETNWPILQPPHPAGRHPLVFTHDKRKAHHGRLDQDTAFVQVTGGGNCTIENARDAMGIDWMTKGEINEAIPPAYTEWVGRQLFERVVRRGRMTPGSPFPRKGIPLTKVCKHCREVKPLDEFAAQGTTLKGTPKWNPRCKVCVRARRAMVAEALQVECQRQPDWPSCACGCGEPVPVMAVSDPRKGWVRGEPHTYVRGHGARVDNPTRHTGHVVTETGCWELIEHGEHTRLHHKGTKFVDGKYVRPDPSDAHMEAL